MKRHIEETADSHQKSQGEQSYQLFQILKKSEKTERNAIVRKLWSMSVILLFALDVLFNYSLTFLST